MNVIGKGILNAEEKELLNNGEKPEKLVVRGSLFNEENMLSQVKSFALSEGLEETCRAVRYMCEKHAGQFRKPGKYSDEQVPYINHPLLMACQAYAFGICDDALLAAILLHDVVEDTEITLNQLPFGDEVKEIVGLVGFFVPNGKTKKQAKDEYYKRISGNGKACVVKIIDRCNNVSTMAGSFDREKLIEYIQETEKYVLPLTDVLENNYPEYRNTAFLIRYQIISILETIKCLILD